MGASNTPSPLSVAHARTRTKAQHSRQGRGRGLGPLKVPDPELLQPRRVPERLPGLTYLAAGVRFSQYREESLIGRGKKREKVAEEGKTQAFSFFSSLFFPPPQTHRRDSVHPIMFFSLR